jgi:hypothetical protein
MHDLVGQGWIDTAAFALDAPWIQHMMANLH